MTTTDKASEELSRLLRGMARRASAMRWNYVDACDQGDMLIRQRDEARAEVDRLRAKLEKAYTLIGERALRDIGIEPPAEPSAPRHVIYRDANGDRWKDFGDGLVFLIEYRGEHTFLYATPQDKATVEREYGPLVVVPASPKARA